MENTQQAKIFKKMDELETYIAFYKCLRLGLMVKWYHIVKTAE